MIREAFATGEPLPSGTFFLEEPVVIDGFIGGSLRGAGPHPYAPWQGSGWDRLKHGTLIVCYVPEGVPAITLRRFTSASIEGVGFARRSPGPIFHVPHVRGWGSEVTSFERVSFVGDGSGSGVTGIRFGDKKSDHNAAGAVFRSCTFSRLQEGVTVMHDQGVVYLFDFCHWYHSGIGVMLHNGGCVQIQSGGTYEVGTVIRTTGGGINAATLAIDGLRCDNNAENQQGQRVVDARGSDAISLTTTSLLVRANGRERAPELPLFEMDERVAKLDQRWRWRDDHRGLVAGGHVRYPAWFVAHQRSSNSFD